MSRSVLRSEGALHDRMPQWPAAPWGYWSVPAVLGLVVAVVLQVNHVAQTDIFLAINKATEANPQIWAGLTLLGDTGVLLCVMAPVLVWHPSLWVSVVAAIPLGGLASVALKWFFDAPRPADSLSLADFHIVGSVLRGHSFPSGHTITAFAAASGVWACWWVLRAKKAAQDPTPLTPALTHQHDVFSSASQERSTAHQINGHAFAAVLVLGAAVLVGISRMAVGAHWPWDIVAGASVGWLAGLNGAYIAHRWQRVWHTPRSVGLLHGLCCALSLDLLHRTMEAPAGVFMLWLGVVFSWGGLCWQIMPMRNPPVSDPN